MSNTYHVTAQRWSGGWELHINGVGVTQARRLSEAESMVRDYIRLSEHLPADGFDLAWEFKVDEEIDPQVKAAKAATAEGASLQENAARQSRQVVERLKARGLSGREIATILGVTPQRVSQLAASASKLRVAGRRRTGVR